MTRPASADPRRRRLLAAGLGTGAWLAGCAAGLSGNAAAQEAVFAPAQADEAGFRLVGDFEPTRAIWLGYDQGHHDFTGALARALIPHVQLRVWVADDGQVDDARTLLRSHGIDVSKVQFDVDEQALYFVRDTAVFARRPALPGTTGPGRLGMVDFRWSHYGMVAWCNRRHTGDAAGFARCAAPALAARREELDRHMARVANARVISTPLYLEGGGIENNGAGVVLVSLPLAQQRNPGVPADLLKAQFEQLPGVSKLIWMAEGLASDPHLRGTITGDYVAWGTGGHTDEFVRFADARTILLAWPDDADVAGHPVARLNRQRMQRNFNILAEATDAAGQPFRIVKVPVPRSVERRLFLSAASDDRFSAEWSADYFPPSERRREGQPVIQVASSSYLNFVVANGVVLVPGYEAHGTPSVVEQRVKRLFQQAFPGREVMFIDALGANWVGGGPHCATLNEPRV